ncbi:hypothetical protein EGM87_14810 [Sphingobium sp. RSMS]|nr:hypothetical protein [Sphingobium sp. RSMS]UXC90299.1 hypothetical protein EGM87_14810 [Sphingobium sp. RSMS]
MLPWEILSFFLTLSMAGIMAVAVRSATMLAVKKFALRALVAA